MGISTVSTAREASPPAVPSPAWKSAWKVICSEVGTVSPRCVRSLVSSRWSRRASVPSRSRHVGERRRERLGASPA